MNLLKSEAVVLRTMELNEADRLITLYGRREGKVRAVAKGARKATSRLAAPTDVLSFGSFVLYRGKSLYTVTQAEGKEIFQRLRADVSRFTYAQCAASLVDHVTADEDPNARVFAVLLETLRRIDRDADPCTAFLWCGLRIMSLSGYRPELDRCSVCGEKPGGTAVAFSPETGGITCVTCHTGIRVSPGTIAMMKGLLGMPSNSLRTLKVEPSMAAEAWRSLETLIEYHVGKPLKSMRVLGQMV